MGCSWLRFQGWPVCTVLMSKAYPLQQTAVGYHPKVEFLYQLYSCLHACNINDVQCSLKFLSLGQKQYTLIKKKKRGLMENIRFIISKGGNFRHIGTVVNSM